MSADVDAKLLKLLLHSRTGCSFQQLLLSIASGSNFDAVLLYLCRFFRA